MIKTPEHKAVTMFSQYLWQNVNLVDEREKRKLTKNQLTTSQHLKFTPVPPRWSVCRWQYREMVKVKIVMSH